MLLGVLILYSVVLLAVEIVTSQDFVRNYFTDIDGPVPFYAVNTSISVFLLWATAVLFAVCFVCVNGKENSRRLQWFFLSQVFVFAFLGLDDRFKFHEAIAWRIGIGDHFVLLAVGACEVGLLAILGGRAIFVGRALSSLIAAIIMFMVMLLFDAVVSHDALLRLSIEDLAKTWANLCFFAFAWQLLVDRIDELKGPTLATSAAS
jgi:hypothetical protein